MPKLCAVPESPILKCSLFSSQKISTRVAVKQTGYLISVSASWGTGGHRILDVSGYHTEVVFVGWGQWGTRPDTFLVSLQILQSR